MDTRTFAPDNGQGWDLDVARHQDPAAFDPELPPILIVPGYGMNSFVLGFHPRGASLVEYLAGRGFEVWTSNLRGQGGSRRRSGSRQIGFRELALVDLPRVLELVRNETGSRRDQLHAIGASLGATLLYAWLARHREDHDLASLVSLGGPLRWDRVHPLLKLLAVSPGIIGRVPMRGTRRLARAVLPLARRFPAVLALYMNASQIDLTDELVQTVEDPHPHLNRQIAHWVRDRELVVDGQVVTWDLANLALPTLCVVANADGIVPPEAVLSVKQVFAPGSVDVLEVGDAEAWFAHADLFVSHEAEQKVFTPMAEWLLARSAGEAPAPDEDAGAA